MRYTRYLAIALVAASLVGPVGAERVRYTGSGDVDLEKLFTKLQRHPPSLSLSRLQDGYRIGRCLLVVDGQTRIAGRCYYSMERDGSFHIDGPHQVFEGIDYPVAQGTVDTLSTDYWANVFRDGNSWRGYANNNVGSVHGEGSDWGELHRNGACLSNARAKICLWAK